MQSGQGLIKVYDIEKDTLLKQVKQDEQGGLFAAFLVNKCGFLDKSNPAVKDFAETLLQTGHLEVKTLPWMQNKSFEHVAGHFIKLIGEALLKTPPLKSFLIKNTNYEKLTAEERGRFEEALDKKEAKESMKQARAEAYLQHSGKNLHENCIHHFYAKIPNLKNNGDDNILSKLGETLAKKASEQPAVTKLTNKEFADAVGENIAKQMLRISLMSGTYTGRTFTDTQIDELFKKWLVFKGNRATFEGSIDTRINEMQPLDIGSTGKPESKDGTTPATRPAAALTQSTPTAAGQRVPKTLSTTPSTRSKPHETKSSRRVTTKSEKQILDEVEQGLEKTKSKLLDKKGIEALINAESKGMNSIVRKSTEYEIAFFNGESKQVKVEKSTQEDLDYQLAIRLQQKYYDDYKKIRKK
jgi:hypothetical protein